MPSEIIQLLDNFQRLRPAPSDKLEFPQVWARFGNDWRDIVPSLKTGDKQDVYSVLFRYSIECEETPDALVIISTGWGAPLGENGEVEGRPSEHAQRVRLALTIGVLPSSLLASRINFIDGDKAGTFDDDEGLATGALAEAVDLLAFSLWGRQFSQALVTRWVEGKDTLPEETLRAMGARVARLVDTLQTTPEEVLGGAL